MNVQQIITYMEHNAYIADEVTDMCIEALKKEAINEQIMWERNIALSQLEEIGVGLGAKMDVVKEAMEKQIPKKVIRERGECYTISRDGIEGYLIYFECPSCGNKLLHKNFPCKCGQKLDWGD